MRAFTLFLLLAALLPLRATTLEQVISRENPNFDCQRARLTAGRDGQVYLCSPGNTSYVLRVTPDGLRKFGGAVEESAGDAVANADGVVAVSHGHFAHKVSVHDTTLTKVAECNDFLVSDAVGWDATDWVAVGASGDFYGADLHRDRIVRVSPQGKLVTSYAIPHDPPKGEGNIQEMRVCEAQQCFVVLLYTGTMRCVGFDGVTRWKMAPGISSNAWEGGNGGYDVDDAGNVYVIQGMSDTLQVFGPDGKALGTVKLQMGDRKPVGDQRICALALAKNQLFIKRRSSTELFQRYDLAGKLHNVVDTDNERLAATYPDDVWLAGKTEPFRIDFTAARPITPQWRVWARPFGTPGWRELTRTPEGVQVPADLSGVYQLKVTPEAQPVNAATPSEYLVQGLVEIRAPDAKGTACVLTPDNRTYYGRGEAIPVRIALCTAPADRPATVKLNLLAGTTVVASSTLPVADANVFCTLSKACTAALAPGRYLLTAEAAGLSGVPQPLVIGPGVREPAFHILDYGDYGPTFPEPDVWDAPDQVAQRLAKLQKLGINLVVDRLGYPLEFSAFAWANRARPELDAMAKRFAADPTAPAPGKLLFAPGFLELMAGYSAQGVQQMAILMGNDAGLPLGSGFDNRKPEQLLADMKKAQGYLGNFPSFRGWSWSSNWWVFDKRGANAAETPEDKTAYQAALKNAKDTGAWDPVLDRVSDIRLNMAVQAQELFNQTLRGLAPGLVTASAAPYRNVEAYPPISLSNVDESDLQAQWEQVAVPYASPNNVDFYTRPGKPSWTHPEIWNDDGTGGQIVPTLFQAVMRGASGAGFSGHVLNWGAMPEDPRLADLGAHSIYRALNGLLKDYGPWFAGMHTNDRVAIVASGRMFRIDEWSSVWGRHYARVKEAYATCLHAHYPATMVFAEDIGPDTLRRYKAILVVDQQVELEPVLRDALRAAKGAGAAVLYDDTCRKTVVQEFTPLGVAFDHFEKDPSPASDDDAYRRFPEYCRADLPTLAQALAAVTPPAAEVNNDMVFITERTAEQGRYLFVVNNANLPLESGQLWRVNLTITSRLPLLQPVKLPADATVVYDCFALQRVTPRDGVVTADLRTLSARVYAILPAAIGAITLKGPAAVRGGQPFAWTLAITDAAGKAIRASIPVRLRVLDAAGTVIEERNGAIGSGGGTGTCTAPVTATGLTLEAVELCGGLTARLAVPVTPAPLTLTQATLHDGVQATVAAVGKTAAAAPIEDSFGPHLRDVALCNNGTLAVLNAMNWDQNLYAVDTATGALRWRARAGGYYAFAPRGLDAGVAVQGFDFTSAEGYHLYLAGADGKFERRFALYGVPGRLPHRFVPAILKDHIDNFAVPASGAWVAAAGDLGLAVWTRDGALRWKQDWWPNKRHTATLGASADTLFVAEGLTVTAYEALTGVRKWALNLADTGEIRAIQVSRDGSTQAVLATSEGGRVFVLRGGKLVTTLLTPAGDLDLTADGARFIVATGTQVKLYTLAGGLQWIAQGDETMRFPRFSPDGKRVAAGSDLGTLYVYDTAGAVLLERDLGALPVPAWLPGGDLLVGTWMGDVTRLSATYTERWHTHLTPGDPARAALPPDADPVPTAKVTGWGTADAQPLPLTPNLLTGTKAVIRLERTSGEAQLQNDSAILYDGKPDAPAKPWLTWGDVGWFAETSPVNYLKIDTYNTQLRVTGITLVEDPAHPESWIRDASFDYWDAAKEQWVTGYPLLSNAAVHTHRFAKPLEASRFRILLPWGVCGNLRLGEIVLHGEAIGNSHPDVLNKRPLATLFDEGNDLDNVLVNQGMGARFQFTGAFSGGRCIALDADHAAQPLYMAPYGHLLPNWGFEIAEKPTPGQYRYLQFAWKATSPATKGMTLATWGQAYGLRAGFYAGQQSTTDGQFNKKVADTPPTDWTVVRVDLWDAYAAKTKGPVILRGMSLTTIGGAALFDQIVLGRTEADLPPIK